MIAIIDYGAGNLRSVKKAFDYLGVANKVVSNVDEARYIEKIVLPGVGAFGMAVERLKESGFFEFLRQWLFMNKPFLGICLGLQLLFETSEEAENVEGLATFNGSNLRFTTGKVPQIGWNQIRIKKNSKLLDGIADQTFFYLVHSYYIAPQKKDIIVATTDYGVSYPTIIESGNIYAVQFHPEKSGESGLKLIKNWVEKC